MTEKTGNVVYLRAPLFAVRQFEQNRHTAHSVRCISDIWLSSRQGKSTNDWHAAREENRSLGQRNTTTSRKAGHLSALALQVAGALSLRSADVIVIVGAQSKGRTILGRIQVK